MPDTRTSSGSLAEIRISELPIATSANTTDQLEANQAGVTRSITVAQIAALSPPPDLSDYVTDEELAAAIGAIPPPPTTLPPSGAAGGDLSGTYPNPTINTSGTLANYLPLAGGQLTAPAVLGWTGKSQLSSPADGNFLLRNNAGSAFGTLQLGGTTNAFPGFLRNGNAISVVLADGSNYATLNANNFNVQNGLFYATFGSISSPGVDGQFEFFNNAGTAGTRLDIATDGTIKFKNRTNTGDAITTFATQPTAQNDSSGATTAFVKAAIAAWPYLPLTGGTLTGPLTGTTANFTANVAGSATVFAIGNSNTGSTAQSVFQQSVGARFVNRTIEYTGQYLIENAFGLPTRYSDFDTHNFRTTAGVGYAVLNSGGLTTSGGSFSAAVTMPTAAPGTNTTQGATTAFVTAAIAAGGGSASPGADSQQVFLSGANVALATQPSFTTLLTLGPVGAAGQKWKVSAVMLAFTSAGQTFLSQAIHNGTSYLCSGEAVNPSANQTVSTYSQALIALTGPTTFTLRGTSSGTGGNAMATTSNTNFPNGISTMLMAERLS